MLKFVVVCLLLLLFFFCFSFCYLFIACLFSVLFGSYCCFGGKSLISMISVSSFFLGTFQIRKGVFCGFQHISICVRFTQICNLVSSAKLSCYMECFGMMLDTCVGKERN